MFAKELSRESTWDMKTSRDTTAYVMSNTADGTWKCQSGRFVATLDIFSTESIFIYAIVLEKLELKGFEQAPLFYMA